MKFIVSRTSCYNKEVAPCGEAKRDSIIRIKTCPFYNPEDFDKKFSAKEGKWHEVGTNHRFNEHGYITRDEGTVDAWSLELDTLDDLIKFCKEYGNVVIQPYYYNKSYFEIEIYDYYRE